MVKENLIKKLSHIIELEISSFNTHQRALDKIDKEDISKHIDIFYNDHLRHLYDLSRVIFKQGGTPPKLKNDDCLAKEIDSVNHQDNVEGALKLMELDELQTNESYRSILEANNDLPREIIDLLRAHYSDERRHLHYIRNTIKILQNPAE